MNATDERLTVLVEFNLKPDMIEAFEAVLIPHLKRVASEKTCLMMLADKAPDNTNRYLLYEQWQNKAEFLETQMNRSYRILYNPGHRTDGGQPPKRNIMAIHAVNNKALV